MPGTHEEIIGLVNSLLTCGIPAESPALPAHRWADGTWMNRSEWADVRLLVRYACDLRTPKVSRYQKEPQRKAMNLLRTLLTPKQRDELSRLRYFYVQLPSGQAFRLDPHRGMTERVERHGKHWFAKRVYCLHDAHDDDRMPPADLTIAHLLLLLSDDGKGESEFLAKANETRRDDQLWNRDYLRRIRERRTQETREHGAA